MPLPTSAMPIGMAPTATARTMSGSDSLTDSTWRPSCWKNPLWIATTIGA